MKLLISGATGLIGSALVAKMSAQGHSCMRLVRTPRTGSTDLGWDPLQRKLDAKSIEGFDAVIHLSGENIAGRWTAKKKTAIRASRVQGTRLLCDTLARLQRRPKVLVSASAMGFYGDRGDEVLTEESASGRGFLPEVCQEWEAATLPAQQAGIRVVLPRLATVLAQQGGALAKMLTPFKLGLGGTIGNGKQYWSWIALEDVVAGIQFALDNESVSGPVNFASPQAVTNVEFTHTLGRALRRPTFCPVPAWAARLALGEMGDALLLASARMTPQKLLAAGYRFQFSDLDFALREILFSTDEHS